MIAPLWTGALAHEPWEHQKAALDHTLSRPTSLLSMDVGTGKSLVAIGTMLARRERVKRVLITCPKSMVYEWPALFERHAGIHIDPIVLPANKTVAAKAKIAKEYLAAPSWFDDENMGLTVIICNLDSVWRQPLADVLLKGDFDMVVVDESQRIAKSGSKVSRFMYKLGNTVPYKMCLTGTPLHDNPLDAFGQFKFLDDEVFGTNFSTFREEYAVTVPGPQPYVPIVVGYRNLSEMADKIRPYAFRVTQDVLDLPGYVMARRHGELAGKARRLYNELDKEFVAYIDDNTAVDASNVLAKLLRLQQIANGYLPDEYGEVHHVDSTKQDMLKDYLQEIPHNEPVVVFTRFHQDVVDVRAAAASRDRATFELSGQCNDLHQWQGDTTGSVLAVNVRAGGAGVDLTRARYAVYYTLPWSRGDRTQTLGRLHRPGQTRSVIYTDLLIRDTVDEQVAAALVGKEDVVNNVMNRLRRHHT